MACGSKAAWFKFTTPIAGSFLGVNANCNVEFFVRVWLIGFLDNLLWQVPYFELHIFWNHLPTGLRRPRISSCFLAVLFYENGPPPAFACDVAAPARGNSSSFSARSPGRDAWWILTVAGKKYLPVSYT